MSASAQPWEQAKPILQEALLLPEMERVAFLDQACGANGELRAYLDRLLGVDPNLLNLFEGFPSPEIEEAIAQKPLMPGDLIDRYQVVRLIGQGGMGQVYEAERRDQTFVKNVAIKVLNQTADRQNTMERFREECQILAKLDHPHIARILDGGVTQSGRVFMVMELVKGTDLRTCLHRNPLSLEALLVLFEKICRAVQYAHQNLIIHRDLKPGNVMVTAEGNPILLDFGISILLSPERGEAEQTRPENRRLTPEYASPEQWTQATVTTATDLYSLGVMLFEALTGRRPFEFRDGERPDKQMGAFFSGELERPSAVVRQKKSKVGSGPEAEPSGRQPPFAPAALRGDLDAIVLKALQVVPERRYASASNLAKDLKRYRLGFPVSVQRESFFYLARKYFQRHRFGVMVGGLFSIGLIVLTVALVLQRNAKVRALESAHKQGTRAGELNHILLDLFSKPDPFRRHEQTLTVKGLIDDALAKMKVQSPENAEIKIEYLLTYGRALSGMGLFDEALVRFGAAQKMALKWFGPDDPRVARALAQRGSVYLLLSQISKGRDDIHQAYSLQSRILDPADPDWIPTLQALGLLQFFFTKHQKGVDYLSEALAIHRLYPGRDDLDLATTYDLLGQHHLYLGNVNPGEDFLFRSFELRLNIWGPEHPFVGESQKTIGHHLLYQGHFEESRLALEHAASIEEGRFEPCHPSPMSTRQKLADIFLYSNQLFEAETLYGINIQCGESQNRPCSMETEISWNNLGVLYRRHGRLEAAQHAFEEARYIASKVYGPVSRPYGRAFVNLGKLALEQNDWDLAREHYETAIDILEKADVRRTFDYAWSLFNLGQIEEKRGNLSLAASLAERALDILKTLFGKEHHTVVKALDLLERCESSGAQLASEN